LDEKAKSCPHGVRLFLDVNYRVHDGGAPPR
jgi:hypothetical protein